MTDKKKIIEVLASSGASTVTTHSSKLAAARRLTELQDKIITENRGDHVTLQEPQEPQDGPEPLDVPEPEEQPDGPEQPNGPDPEEQPEGPEQPDGPDEPDPE